MRRIPVAAISFAGALLALGLARAATQGYWNIAGGDAEHDSWQRDETKITKDSLAGAFRFLWKIKLGDTSAKSPSFSEPLLLHFLPTSRGFKDMALWGDSDTLYAVDSELGTLIWQKEFQLRLPRAQEKCGESKIRIAVVAPRSIRFGAHETSAPHPAASASPSPPPGTAPRRLGAVPVGMRGIYVLTSDGYIHEQILSTGRDYAPAARFVPAPNGNPSALNIYGDVVYAETGGGCGNLPHAVWSIDLDAPDYMVHSYNAQKTSLPGFMGPAIGANGTIYIMTGNRRSDLSRGAYADRLVALTAKDLEVKDWFDLASGGKDTLLNAAPVALIYRGTEVIAAPGPDGSIVLLDSRSLGGADHHTSLARTGRISKVVKSGAWESLAGWQDESGALWVLASISGPVDGDIKFADTHGPAPDGSIVAFKVEEGDGRLTLTPSWISRDLKNPAPPAIVNGIVFALSGGDARTHARLYALDATTGKELYSSGEAIQSYTDRAGIAVGDGHLFFTTRDNTLYSFGIPMEH